MILTVPSSLKEWSGSITVPDHHEFNGGHFDFWRERFNAINAKTNEHRAFAYTFAQLASEFGGWSVERFEIDENGTQGEKAPFALSDFLAWQANTSAEKFQLVGWLGVHGRAYFQQVTAPFG